MLKCTHSALPITLPGRYVEDHNLEIKLRSTELADAVSNICEMNQAQMTQSVF
jgi:hypothetical protein